MIQPNYIGEVIFRLIGQNKLLLLLLLNQASYNKNDLLTTDLMPDYKAIYNESGIRARGTIIVYYSELYRTTNQSARRENNYIQSI